MTGRESRQTPALAAAVLAAFVGIAAGIPSARCEPGQADVGNAAPRPLNVIVLLADDMGWGDLGCQGHPFVKTPSIDRLAATGCRFDQFYVTAPICSPSRAGLMTGRIQNRFGMQALAGHADFHHVPVDEPTLPRLLKTAGYTTFHVGKWHLSSVGSRGEPAIADYGLDHSLVLGAGHYNSYYSSSWRRDEVPIRTKGRWTDEVYVDEAMKFIERAGSRPFFINLWSFAPHQEDECAPRYRAMYGDRTEGEQYYYGTITQMDEQYGRLLDYLDRTGLSKNTIVIFTSDNGPPTPLVTWSNRARGATGGLRGGKYTLYEGGIRLPGIIRWPGVTRPGTVSHEVCWTPDILATLCAAFGASLPKGLPFDGIDIRPALRGGKLARAEPLYWQFPFGNKLRDGTNAASPGLALRDGVWKLHCDLGFQRVELYNLDLDRNEQSNVKDLYPEITERLLAKMRTMYADVNGPYSRTAKFINPQLTYKIKKQLPEGRPWLMTCEHRHNPLGIDRPAPRLSWKVARDVPGGISQSAYQIVVTSGIPSGDEHRDADIWDSGKVASTQSTGISYGGPPLRSKQRYYWKVRTWDASGKVWDWSEVSWWEMGPLLPADWAAKWIGPRTGGSPSQASAVCLRKTFAVVTMPIKRARLYVRAKGRCEMHFNAERLALGGTGRCTTYDVTGMVTDGGVNAIGAVLEPGPGGGGTALLAQLEIVDSKGKHLIVVTDDSWKCATSNPGSGDWDAPGYPSYPGYDPSDWKSAVVVAEPISP